MSATTDFQAACVPLEGARQVAVEAAHLAYRVARQAQLETFEIALSAVRRRHDLLKSDAEHPDLPAATAALDAMQQPSPRRLLADLDRAIAVAAQQHKEAVAALRVQ